MNMYYVVFSTGHAFKLKIFNGVSDNEIAQFIFNYAHKNIDAHLTYDYDLIDDRFYVYTDTGKKISAILYNDLNCYTLK